MNEKLAVIGKKLVNYVHHIAIFLFVVLIGSSWYVYNQEKSSTPPVLNPQTPISFQGKFDQEETQDNLAKIQDAFLDKPVVEGETVPPEADINSDPQARRLVQISMFDPQTVRDAERVEQAVREDFSEAQDLARRNEYDAAIAKLNSILDRFPTHRNSRRLLDEMQTAKAAAEAAQAEQEEQ